MKAHPCFISRLFTPRLVNLFIQYLSLLLLSFSSFFTYASFESDKVDAQKYLVGTYSGTIKFKKPQPVEIALWFTVKGTQYEHSKVSGVMTIGADKAQCKFKLVPQNFYFNVSASHYSGLIKKVLSNFDNPMNASLSVEPVLNDRNCFSYGIVKRRESSSTSLSLIGEGDNKRFQLIFYKIVHGRFKNKSTNLEGELVRHSPSSSIQELWKVAKSLQLDAPNDAELTMLKNARQKLSPELASNIVVRGCTDFYKEAKENLAKKGIDRIATFTVGNDFFLRLSKKNNKQYIQHKVSKKEKSLLSKEQWKALTLAAGHSYAGDKGCAFANAHKVASTHSLIEKHMSSLVPAISNEYVINKNQDIFVVESTGVDVIRAKARMVEESMASRRYGVTGIFKPGDYTRKFVWSEKLQKASTLSYYKDFHSGKTFGYREDEVEAFFAPVENAVKQFGHPVLSLVATKPMQYKVCPTWYGKEKSSICPKKIDSVKSHQLFVTHSEEAALALYKTLSPQAMLDVEKISPPAYNNNCLTKEYCNFPAASFIVPIYNNNYGKFKVENERYTKQMLNKYKDHILVTNVILDSMGIETSKESKLNLFPYFSEYYLHLFNEKYPSCKRLKQALSIRSDTQAYNIVDQWGNVVEKHDSVALYSDYNIPTSLVSMCNDICGQTGPSRSLSDFSNMMAHPSMVRILEGINKTMDTFTCDSTEILTLEAGMLGVYDSLKTRHKQQPYQERSSLL